MIDVHEKPTLQRITVAIPTSLLERLHKRISTRQRSQFIIQAIEEQLALAEQVSALDEAVGLWNDELHPELQTPDDVNQWVKSLRSSWSIPLLILEQSGHEPRIN